MQTIRRLSFVATLLGTGAFAQDPNFHIYLAFGQSNMEGQGAIENQDKSVDSRFQVIAAVSCSNLGRTQGQWYTAVPPLFRCNTGLSPVDYFGRTMVANLPDNIKVGVVDVAVAGSKIELFDKANYQSYASGAESWMKNIIAEYGGNPYGRLVELAKEAQKVGVIKGILLHQGESNTGEQQWPAKVKGVYDNLIQDLGLDASKVPLLAGEVVTTAQGGSCGSMNSIIDNLSNTIPTAHVVSASGLPHQGDNLHFTSASYRTLGTRYAETMLGLLGDVGGGPVVTITSPDTGGAYEAPATIPIAATVTSDAATVLQVVFRSGADTLQKFTAAPYQYSWTNVGAGTHTITVEATDSQGNKGSASIQIRVSVPQAPYGDSVRTVPGTIEAEHFDAGGNGTAYFDDSPGSETGVDFRSDEDVDIEVSTDAGGGYNLGWATAGEWLEYTVDVAYSGTYSLTFRIACDGTGRTLSLSSNGSDLVTDLAIPNTGGWQEWTDLTVDSIHLDAGKQVLRLTIGATSYINLNYMTFTAKDPVPVRKPTSWSGIVTRIQAGELQVQGAPQGATVRLHGIQGELVAILGERGGHLPDYAKGILLVSVVSPEGNIVHFRVLRTAF